MDESRLKTICRRHSYYISLQDQKVAVSRLEGTPISSLRYKVSKKRTTRIYFATYHSQHGAAIQISISPFEIPAFPKQKFYNCCLRYTSCCEGASRTWVEAKSWKAAQRIYDFYFHPTEWDFSSEYSRRIDLPTPRSVLNETTCAEKLEAALTGYIQLANKEDDDENDPGNLDTVKQIKRCRQYPNNFRNGNETSDDNEICADAARSFKRRRRDKFREGNYTGHADDNSHENDNCDADENSHEDENGDADENDNFDDNSDANRDSDADNNGDAENVSLVLLHQRLNTSNHDKIREENDTSNYDEAAEDKYVTAISKKIRKGIEQVLRKKRNKNNHCSDVAATGAKLSTEIIPTDFEYAFLRGEFGVKDRLLCLQIVLWQKSSRVIRDARSISWKCSFIAACLSRIGNPELSDIENTAVSKSTRVRWAIAAWLINFIVNGLWSVWGPTAALVYEALASKNYNMSRLTKLGWPALHRIGRRIIESLAKDPTPLLSSDICVFHPAACVGTALNMNYKETCRVIGLEESFSKLDPPQDSQSHTPISSLLHQWIQYKSAFDTLVAVADAEMGHDTDHPLGIEQPALDDSVSNSAYQLLTIGNAFNGRGTSAGLEADDNPLFEALLKVADQASAGSSSVVRQTDSTQKSNCIDHPNTNNVHEASAQTESWADPTQPPLQHLTLPQPPYGILHPPQLNPSTAPFQQQASNREDMTDPYWGDMIDPYWEDMIDLYCEGTTDTYLKDMRDSYRNAMIASGLARRE